MCRWLAYIGPPKYLDEFIVKPGNSLIEQSIHCTEGKKETNADGVGVAWYGDRDAPGIYKNVLPAWSDNNLISLAETIRSGLFFAHIRASTGTSTSRTNCHPFFHRKWLFMHNGQVGNYSIIRRQMEGVINDESYDALTGQTDSELLFLRLTESLSPDNVGESLVNCIQQFEGFKLGAVPENSEASKHSICLTQGDTIYAYRWTSKGVAPTIYWRQLDEGMVVVSEPLFEVSNDEWHPLPERQLGCFTANKATIMPFIEK